MTRPFDRVLIANRGEIALRVIRTCRVLGIETVAVFSDADADARHVQEADHAVLLGPAEARASYLDVAKVVQAAVDHGAQAVHPGYGFLSENARLARALEDAGVVFVGPPADVLEASSDKLVVKQRMAKAGVPVIPGPLDVVSENDDALRAAADATGLPLLLKAVAGGGGKGMRRVDTPDQLTGAAESARREAGGAFGETALYVERVIEPARHVEVQVLADNHGAVVTLGERDCSLQRRHQKVIEESPAPGLTDVQRAAAHEAGANAARALGYRGAGTVEMLLGADGTFAFLECNRRLQVEHPVTEMCYGVDLVEWQLRIAAGEALPEQDTFVSRGHAIEARVYAEDPSSGFLPSPGTVRYAVEPEGPGVRVDSALRSGLEVSAYYDPLLAKIIAHGENRAQAQRRLVQALRETVVMGVRHNIAFLIALLEDGFDAATLRIDAIDRDPTRFLPEAEVPAIVQPIADAARARGTARRRQSASATAVVSPWDTLGAFRAGPTS